MLTDTQLTEFHDLLTARLEQLSHIEESARGAAGVVELDQTRVGRVSRMDALQGQAMAQEGERRRGLESRKIVAALQRLAAGEYGFCLRCDELIAVDRLHVDPAATLCIRCASEKA